MKGRPIFLSPEMAAAVRDGWKSQHRAIIVPQPIIKYRSHAACALAEHAAGGLIDGQRAYDALHSDPIPTHPEHGGLLCCPYDKLRPGRFCSLKLRKRWMPLGEIIDVRVQRVREIASDPAHNIDARREGWPGFEGNVPTIMEQNKMAIRWFHHLWDRINAAPKPAKHNPYSREPEPCWVSHPWDDVRETRIKAGLNWYVVGNPFVWAMAFRRIDA